MNNGTLFTGIGGASETARAAEAIDHILHAQPEEERPRHLDFIRPGQVEIEGLDPGIADAVHLLRLHHFPTFASCQGGEGHAFQHPVIRIHTRFSGYPDDWVSTWAVAQVLTSHGYHGFYIKRVDCYQIMAEPWQPGTQSFIEIEFWGDKDQLRPESGE